MPEDAAAQEEGWRQADEGTLLSPARTRLLRRGAGTGCRPRLLGPSHKIKVRNVYTVMNVLLVYLARIGVYLSVIGHHTLCIVVVLACSPRCTHCTHTCTPHEIMQLYHNV